MSRGILVGYDTAVARARRVDVPTVVVKGRRYPTIPAGDLTVGARVVSPEGHLYTLMAEPLGAVTTLLVVQGPNGAQYRWRRKLTTRVPVSWDWLRSR